MAFHPVLRACISCSSGVSVGKRSCEVVAAESNLRNVYRVPGRCSPKFGRCKTGRLFSTIAK